MLPLRHAFIRFGGSWSQRQVFNVTMIKAARKANNCAVAMGLVAEIMVHWTLLCNTLRHLFFTGT